MRRAHVSSIAGMGTSMRGDGLRTAINGLTIRCFRTMGNPLQYATMTTYAPPPTSRPLGEKEHSTPAAMQTHSSAAGWTMLRFAIFTILIFSTLAALPMLAGRFGSDFFLEDGPIEVYHILAMACAGVALLIAAVQHAPMRTLLVILALMTAMASIRELDRVLDHHLPALGWKPFFAAVVLMAIVVAWRGRAALVGQVRRYATTTAFGVQWAGFVIIVMFAQLVGHGEFLEALLAEHFHYSLKRVTEELLEAMGYTLVLIGSIELALTARTMKPSGTA